MNNLKSIQLFLFIIVSINAFAQEVEVIDLNDAPTKAVDRPEAFDFIYSGYELEEASYIATLSGKVTNSSKSILSNIFNSFWHHANKLGANSFLIDSVSNRNDTSMIQIKVLHLTDIQYDEMMDLYPTNMVYVLGDLDKRRSPKTIKVNNEKIELAPLEYIALQNVIGENVTLSIGGIFGAKVWVKGEEHRLPAHFSLNGVGVGPGRHNEIGISLNTGRIYPMDLNFGQFLINILEEKE